MQFLFVDALPGGCRQPFSEATKQGLISTRVCDMDPSKRERPLKALVERTRCKQSPELCMEEH